MKLVVEMLAQPELILTSDFVFVVSRRRQEKRPTDIVCKQPPVHRHALCRTRGTCGSARIFSPATASEHIIRAHSCRRQIRLHIVTVNI